MSSEPQILGLMTKYIYTIVYETSLQFTKTQVFHLQLNLQL